MSETTKGSLTAVSTVNEQCDPAEDAAPFSSRNRASLIVMILAILVPIAGVALGLVVISITLLLQLLQGKFDSLVVAIRNVFLVFALALFVFALGTTVISEFIKSKIYEPYRIFRQRRGGDVFYTGCTQELYKPIGYTYVPPSVRASDGSASKFMPESNSSEPHLQPGIAARFLDHLRHVAAMVHQSVISADATQNRFVDDGVVSLVVAKARLIASRRYYVERVSIKIMAGFAIPSILLVLLALVANAIDQFLGGVSEKNGVLALVSKHFAIAAVAGIVFLQIAQTAKRVITQSERLLAAIGQLENAYQVEDDEGKILHANALEAFAWSFPQLPSKIGRMIIPGAFVGLFSYIIYKMTRSMDLREHVEYVRNMTRQTT